MVMRQTFRKLLKNISSVMVRIQFIVILHFNSSYTYYTQ